MSNRLVAPCCSFCLDVCASFALPPIRLLLRAAPFPSGVGVGTCTDLRVDKTLLTSNADNSLCSSQLQLQCHLLQTLQELLQAGHLVMTPILRRQSNKIHAGYCLLEAKAVKRTMSLVTPALYGHLYSGCTPDTSGPGESGQATGHLVWLQSAFPLVEATGPPRFLLKVLHLLSESFHPWCWPARPPLEAP